MPRAACCSANAGAQAAGPPPSCVPGAGHRPTCPGCRPRLPRALLTRAHLPRASLTRVTGPGAQASAPPPSPPSCAPDAGHRPTCPGCGPRLPRASLTRAPPPSCAPVASHRPVCPGCAETPYLHPMHPGGLCSEKQLWAPRPGRLAPVPAEPAAAETAPERTRALLHGWRSRLRGESGKGA